MWAITEIRLHLLWQCTFIILAKTGGYQPKSKKEGNLIIAGIIVAATENRMTLSFYCFKKFRAASF